MHSPFVFDFIKFVLNDKTIYPIYAEVERMRTVLLCNNESIEVEDFGAGSSLIKTKKRIVKDIASSSLKPKKYSQLLFRIIKYYNKRNILELGTSLGITTAYLSSVDDAKVTTMEGSQNIANIAKQNFNKLKRENICLTIGEFGKTLPTYLQSNKNIDLAFIDGNHRKNPTIEYFKQLLPNIDEETFLIFDDIHWSKEMEEAWEYIKKHTAVTLSIDLFFIGIVFFKKDFKVKQHFTIRF